MNEKAAPKGGSRTPTQTVIEDQSSESIKSDARIIAFPIRPGAERLEVVAGLREIRDLARAALAETCDVPASVDRIARLAEALKASTGGWAAS